MKNKILLFILLIISLIISSCNNSTDPGEISEFIFKTPIVTGLIITNDDPTAIKVWRNPQFPADKIYCEENNHFFYYKNPSSSRIPCLMNLYYPFPNPSSESVNLEFSLPIKTKVTIWVVKARLPEAGEKDFEETSGGNFIASANKVIAKLIDDELNAGYYKAKWDCSEVPSGFYRVYFKADSHLFWKDILLARSINDMPNDLRQLLKNK